MLQQVCRGQKGKLQLKRAAGRRVRNQDDQSLLASPSLGPPPALLSKTSSPVLYCESILHGRHNPFLSYLADKAGISHSYQNKRESSQSDRGYLSSAGIHYSLHCPSQTTSTTVSPPLGYQMCMAQFGMRDTQINMLPQECKGETSRRVSKGNILGFICIAAVSWLL